MEITLAAQKYLSDLLLKQKLGAEIRVFVTDAGFPYAKCGVCFCFFESFQVSDVIINFDCISVRVEQCIIPFLKDAIIDVVVNVLDSTLTFKAPYARKFLRSTDSVVQEKFNSMSLEEKIRSVIDRKINPQLFVHGGSVSLVSVTKDLLVVLKFLGGCNGCAMSNYTMKSGIESTLLHFFPELKGVCDVTDHRHGSHSYY